MTLDYQQVSEQVRQLGEAAVIQHQEQKSRLELAERLLAEHAQGLDELCARVEVIVRSHDPSLRCALPVGEALDACLPLPELPPFATILAADGSQINPDRHEQVAYGLVNVGAIRQQLGRSVPPETTVSSRLIYHENIAEMSEGMLALARDLSERAMLADLAALALPPVVTFTDGPMELWGAKAGGGGAEASEYQHSLLEYLQVLGRLHDLEVVTAGYVDKPGANLVVRLLEVSMTPPEEWSKMREHPPLRGVTDLALYRPRLVPGERSAVFALQSQSSKSYQT
jgi:hypothetical protein